MQIYIWDCYWALLNKTQRIFSISEEEKGHTKNYIRASRAISLTANFDQLHTKKLQPHLSPSSPLHHRVPTFSGRWHLMWETCAVSWRMKAVQEIRQTALWGIISKSIIWISRPPGINASTSRHCRRSPRNWMACWRAAKGIGGWLLLTKPRGLNIIIKGPRVILLRSNIKWIQVIAPSSTRGARDLKTVPNTRKGWVVKDWTGKDTVYIMQVTKRSIYPDVCTDDVKVMQGWMHSP